MPNVSVSPSDRRAGEVIVSVDCYQVAWSVMRALDAAGLVAGFPSVGISPYTVRVFGTVGAVEGVVGSVGGAS